MLFKGYMFKKFVIYCFFSQCELAHFSHGSSAGVNFPQTIKRMMEQNISGALEVCAGWLPHPGSARSPLHFIKVSDSSRSRTLSWDGGPECDRCWLNFHAAPLFFAGRPSFFVPLRERKAIGGAAAHQRRRDDLAESDSRRRQPGGRCYSWAFTLTTRRQPLKLPQGE